MAELNVVRKKKSPLPWIILALLVLGLLAWLLLRNSDTVTTIPATADTTGTYERQNNTP